MPGVISELNSEMYLRCNEFVQKNNFDRKLFRALAKGTYVWSECRRNAPPCSGLMQKYLGEVEAYHQNIMSSLLTKQYQHLAATYKTL